MRALIQRIQKAAVHSEGELLADAGPGLLVFIGIEEADGREDIEWLCGKIARLRIFNDDHGVMNLSVKETSGDILVVSQFTLHASTRKGNRPSYIRAAGPETAIPLYGAFVDEISLQAGKKAFTGRFGADMQVSLVNDGPVSIIIDTKNRE
jgi:D-aminoacyl-tRNA deacylase